MYELANIKPNEYFYKHHKKEGEDKWETYMRVTRQIMSDASGLELSENYMEQKMEYKNLLYKKKSK